MMLAMILKSCGTSYQLQKELKRQNLSSNFYRGFVLYDPVSKKKLISYQGNKYFTPASNTKLYTFYAAYKTFKDSVKSFEYYQTKDSLIIRGTADPSFLYGFDSTRVVNFLKKDTIPVYLIDAKIDEPAYGSGWAWDDYSYYYMPEKSLFPIHGNVVTYSYLQDSITCYPSFFKNNITLVDSLNFNRENISNQFYLEKNSQKKRYVPYITSNALTANLLSDLLQKKVNLVPDTMKFQMRPFFGAVYDSLYKQLLVISDNFIAEQLMLQVGKETSDSYSVKKGIDYALQNYLNDLPHEPRWVDGSGLSRYNLFTPDDMVYLLDKMYREIPREKLFAYLPVGGESGTLKNWYGAAQPFVYAKSGTLSNNYNLSGYIRTKKGSVLIFSSMNNHFRVSMAEVKTEIEKLLLKIYNSY